MWDLSQLWLISRAQIWPNFGGSFSSKIRQNQLKGKHARTDWSRFSTLFLLLVVEGKRCPWENFWLVLIGIRHTSLLPSSIFWHQERDVVILKERETAFNWNPQKLSHSKNLPQKLCDRFSYSYPSNMNPSEHLNYITFSKEIYKVCDKCCKIDGELTIGHKCHIWTGGNTPMWILFPLDGP